MKMIDVLIAWSGESSSATSHSCQVDWFHGRHSHLRPPRLVVQDHSPGGASAEPR